MHSVDMAIRLSRVPLQLGVVAALPYRFPSAPHRPDAGLLPLAAVAQFTQGICDASALRDQRLRPATVNRVVARFDKVLADLATAIDAPGTTADQRDKWRRAIGSGEAARDLFVQFTEGQK